MRTLKYLILSLALIVIFISVSCCLSQHPEEKLPLLILEPVNPVEREIELFKSSRTRQVDANEETMALLNKISSRLKELQALVEKAKAKLVKIDTK